MSFYSPGIYAFADVHNLPSLKQQAELYIEKNFLIVIQEEEFCQLGLDNLMSLLSSERLHIDGENQVCLEKKIIFQEYLLVPLKYVYILLRG